MIEGNLIFLKKESILIMLLILLINMYLKELIFIVLFYFKNKLGKSTTIPMNGQVSKQIINKFRKTNKLEKKKNPPDNCDNVVFN